MVKRTQGRLVLSFVSGLAIAVVAMCQGAVPMVMAAPPAQNPQSGSVGLQGTVPSNPPTKGATITSPTPGQSFTRTPIAVSGLCPSGLLVKVFANNVFVGSVLCVNGSYSLQIDLFDGQNDIVSRVFDALDQPGPDSTPVTVTFINEQFRNTGFPSMSLTSNYARRGANPNQLLTWPIILSGGTAPFAVSVSWGDTKPASLLSLPFAGPFDISHIYDAAGVYNIVIKATDKNGVTAYLQLVGEANGAVTQAATDREGAKGQEVIVKILWIPAVVCLPLLFVAFWLGRKHELATLRKHLEDTQA